MKKQVGLAVSIGLLTFCSYAQEPAYVPVTPESLGLTRIVPDTLIWFNDVAKKPQIGGYVPGTEVPILNNQEATAHLLSDSIFLIAATTLATNDTQLQSRTLAIIPATGGTPKISSLFYTDAGQIHLENDNTSRQDGNPGRVGGDTRYGAVNYMTAAEATLFSFPADFGSNDRWTNPLFESLAGISGRDYEAQNFQLNPLTLAVTPLHKGCSPMFWPTRTNDTAISAQLGRTGSKPIGLANGNFVTVGEDRSQIENPGFEGNSTATIFKPDGTIVKNAFSVDPAGGRSLSMWDSVGAWRGGWYARPAGDITYVFDNDGIALGTITNNPSAGTSFDAGRGDNLRMCSDIRSHYIFMAGPSSNTNVVLSVWDANTRLWITNTIVSEGPSVPDVTVLGGTRPVDRTSVACDAYDRVTVVYRVQPDNGIFLNAQVAARVYKFDGTKFIPLTPSFFPFIESDGRAVSDGTNVLGTPVGFLSQQPSVAVTPRQILIYAKGTWNGIPDATNAPVTVGANQHCYTILSHPVPIAAPQPQMTFTLGSQSSTISWKADDGLFILQSSPAVSPASWTDVSPQPAITRNAYVDKNDKYLMSVPTPTSAKFFRLVRHW